MKKLYDSIIIFKMGSPHLYPYSYQFIQQPPRLGAYRR